MSGRRMRMWAGGIMVAQGAAHGVVSAIAARDQLGEWLDGVLWGTNTPSPDGGEMQQAAAYFWSGPASFAVPLLLLGSLVLWLARNDHPVPAFVGWGFGIWGVACAAIAGPATPFTSALIPAALVVLAASREGRGPVTPERGQQLVTR